nr:hypothetical protein BaRGS_031477 [Batillaria attramentaria]
MRKGENRHTAETDDIASERMLGGSRHALLVLLTERYAREKTAVYQRKMTWAVGGYKMAQGIPENLAVVRKTGTNAHIKDPKKTEAELQ